MDGLPESLGTAPIAAEKLPREILISHQRQRILDAAIELFAKRGFQRTTVEAQIVPAAKVSIGTFYQHFADKEACFLAAYDQIVAEAHDQIAGRVPQAGWPEQLVAALSAVLDYIAEDRFKARLVIVEAAAAGPVALARYQATLELLAPLLARGRELCSTDVELPATLETSTIGGLLWVLQQRIMAGEFEASTDLLRDLAEMVAGPYLGEAASRELVPR